MFGEKFKLPFVITIVALLLFSCSTVFAAQNNPIIKRLSGLNRYETSSVIALSKWTKSDYAILAYGEDFPDALSAAPLAKKYNAPILLTKTNTIPAETLSTIQKLKIKNIIIIGGTSVISSAVEGQLSFLDIKITRISGQDRYETGIKIAEQLDNVTEIAIVTGESFSDALSVSPIAVKRNMPIILVGHNEIPRVVTDYINKHKLTKTYVIGSGTSLNKSILSSLSNVQLITGDDKYQSNLNIIDKFKGELDLGTLYVATGENFADALSGSILAGLNSNPLVLIGKDSSLEKKYFASNSINISNINVLGGTGVFKDEDINKLTSKTTSSAVDKIQFSSTKLTKTGKNTATFNYKLLDGKGDDITKVIPASQLEAVAVVSSSIKLDPSTGIGTVTFNSESDTDKAIIITLVDNLSGIMGTLNPDTSVPETIEIPASAVYEIDFISPNLTKISPNTATFQYKILNKVGTDITKMIPASQLITAATVISTITLSPSKGLGTVTYNSRDDLEKSNIITIVDDISGVVGSNIEITDATSSEISDTGMISKITITSTQLSIAPEYKGVMGNGYATYVVEDENGIDISFSKSANNINFKSSVGTVFGKNGLLTVTPNSGVDLSKLDSIVITGSDPDTGVSISSTLNCWAVKN